MTRNNKILIPLFLLVLSLGFISLWFGFKSNSAITNNDVPIPSPTVTIQPQATSSGILVAKVIDGDTIKLINGSTVRLIGIDTPETVDPRRPVGCFGKEASNETKKLIERKAVVLEKDVSEVDKYQRLLRYVYLPLEDGQLLFINDYLVREGFAKVLTYPPDVKYNEQLREAEKSAREGKKGLWGRC